MLVLAALALAVPQAVIERSMTEARSITNVSSGQLGLASAGEESASAAGSVGFPSVSNVDGAQLLSVSFGGTVLVESELTVRGINPGGSLLRVTTDGSLNACGAGCNWGSHDLHSYGGGGGYVAVSMGQEVTDTRADPETVGGYIDAWNGTSYAWQQTQLYPGLEVSAHFIQRWASYDLGLAAPIDVEVLSYTVRASVEFTATARYELDQAETVGYCDSQANATGQMATLQAYGSRRAGTRFLSIRATDVPQGSVGILFASSVPASVPGATSTLCVGGAIQRLGGVQPAPTGTLTFDIDLVGRAPGDIVYFQAYFRDPLYDACASEGALVRVQ